MSETKRLELVKKPYGKLKGVDRFRYQVYENNVILCQRVSCKNYVACYVTKWEYLDHPHRKIGDPPATIYETPYFFSRVDLMGKGDSRHFLSNPNAYGIAYLKEETNENTN
jgi:hypothetical protein